MKSKIVNSPKSPLLYVDLLGFSHRILNCSMSDALQFYSILIAGLKLQEDVWNKMGTRIKFQLVSDSIFFWVDWKGGDESLSTSALISIASVLLHNAANEGQPLRGALCYDEFVIDQVSYGTFSPVSNHTILGKAIVKAASWEKEQLWSGISICPEDIVPLCEILERVKSEVRLNHFLVEYDVPVRSGKKRTLVINPVTKQAGHAKYFLDHLERQEKQNSNAGVRTKISNSIEFIKWVEVNNKFTPNHWEEHWMKKFRELE